MKILQTGATITVSAMSNWNPKDYTVGPEQASTYTIKTPEYSDWQCDVFGDHFFVFIPKKGNHPNWFNRKMQEWCFGVKWRKLK